MSTREAGSPSHWDGARADVRAGGPPLLPEGCHGFELQGPNLDCEWNVVDLAGGEFDRSRVNVRIDDGLPIARTALVVPDPASCADVEDGWYWVNVDRSDMRLCPSTCADTKVDSGASYIVEIAVPPRGCTPPAP